MMESKFVSCGDGGDNGGGGGKFRGMEIGERVVTKAYFERKNECLFGRKT